MEYKIRSGIVEKQRTACLATGIFHKRSLSDSAKRLDTLSNGAITTILRQGDMDPGVMSNGSEPACLMLYNLPNLLCERVLLVDCGNADQFDQKAYRKAIRVVARTLAKANIDDALICLNELTVADHTPDWKIQQAIMGIEEIAYQYTRTKASTRATALKKVSFLVGSRSDIPAAKTSASQAIAISEGIALARELGNLPANICTPGYLADQAKEIKKGHRKAKLKVLEEQDMLSLGMGALLSVSKGSELPAKLIILKYNGGGKDDRPIALVGKGITFDTGGISLKPGAQMDEMKFDMCGAASVMGTFHACVAMDLPINLVCIVASAENMPGGRASKPGDVVTTMSGQTVEILNTDAEGRLVLCDALSYCERFDPEVVIDVATLTGACITALGHVTSGLFSNHQPLAEDLMKAGADSGDRAWQLPLWDDYQRLLNSNFADIANIGDKSAGAITAACFLSRFTKKYHWAHLDIAGTAWLSGAEKGATGRPVPLLIQYIMNKVIT